MWRHNNLPLDIALGNIPGYKAVNKFGHAPAGVQITTTDIWDRADATPTQQIWVAPTQARIHAIVSSSAEDGAGTETGAITLRVYGLTSWDSEEVNEDITLAGTTPKNTANSYVIIHRMAVILHNAFSNVGTITATAAVDGTVTAAVLPLQGQTQMAIYGVPSTQRFAVSSYYASAQVAGAGPTVAVDINLCVNNQPDFVLGGCVVKHTQGISGSATSILIHKFDTPLIFNGPAILIMRATSSAADTGVSAGFDGVLVDKP